MVGAHAGIKVAQKDDLFVVGDIQVGAEFTLASGVDVRVGA